MFELDKAIPGVLSQNGPSGLAISARCPGGDRSPSGARRAMVLEEDPQLREAP